MITDIKKRGRVVDATLNKRADLFDQLIVVVNKHIDLDSAAISQVPILRKEAVDAGRNFVARMEAESKITGLAKEINRDFEGHPDLKVDKEAIALREKLIALETQLGYDKQLYNAAIDDYYARKSRLFASIVVKAFKSQLDRRYHRWRLGAEKI